MRGGLGKSLLIAFLLLAIIPLSLLSILIYNRIQYDVRQKLLASLDTMVALKEAHLVDWVESHERELSLLAAAPAVETDTATLLAVAPGAERTLTGLVLLDRDTGVPIATTGINEADFQALEPLLTSDHRMMIVPESAVTGEPLVAISYDWAARRLVGLLPWESLQQIVTGSDRPEVDLTTSLITADGLIVSAEGPAHLSLDDPHALPDGVQKALQGWISTGSYTNLDGVPVFGAYRWSPELRVALLAEQHQTEALEAGNTLTALIVGATLIVALVTTIIAAVVTRRITRPIVELTETAAWMARGNLSRQVTVTRRDEIGILGRAFNRMAAELRVLYSNLEAKVEERTQQLQVANERTSYYAMQLALSAEVARVATSIRDTDILLTTVARLINEAFELYHVSVYLLDDSTRWVIWQAGSKSSHSVPERVAVGDATLVGQVAADGRRRTIWFSEEESIGDLTVVAQPPVECEMALPLRVQDRLLGVIDLQSSRPSSFHEEDQGVYQSLADQISIAIENARAYAVERETIERMQELDRIQSEFLTNMSHALRTPLNSIIGFSRVILKELDGPLTDMQRMDLETVYESGRQLLGLINDMLDLTQLDLGTAPISSAEVDLGEIVEGVMATAQALARGKSLQVYEEVPSDLPTLHTDGQRVRQVILALLSNAVKYTDEGSIRLRVTVIDEHVVISVSDTGIGVPREERDRIFSDSRYNTGDASGFGLAISKRVVERLGGEIWLESTDGVGSTFTFTLPIRSTEMGPLDEEKSQVDAG
jgi:signal transduction histidine kinase